jgi:hypothetical protein
MLNFYCVNDNQEVNVEKTQIMCCIFCYNGLFKVSNSRTKTRKWKFSYCKIDEIPTSKKHVDMDHAIVAKRFKDELNFL